MFYIIITTELDRIPRENKEKGERGEGERALLCVFHGGNWTRFPLYNELRQVIDFELDTLASGTVFQTFSFFCQISTSASLIHSQQLQYICSSESGRSQNSLEIP